MEMTLTDNLQLLVNSLKHSQKKSTEGTWARFKVLPYEIGRNHNGQLVKTPNERFPFLHELLFQNYRLEIESRNMTLEKPDTERLEQVYNFLSDEKEKTSLLLRGTPGTGKTTIMNSVYQTLKQLYKDEIQQKRMVIRYVKASETGVMLKDDRDEYLNVRKAAVLFIDDMGYSGTAENVNNYGVKTNPIIDIIEHRYDRQLMTLITTNLTESEILETYGQRVHSRIVEMCKWITFDGYDYRLQN